jgi:monovalent cation:H+ antiporter, CPA1 family
LSSHNPKSKIQNPKSKMVFDLLLAAPASPVTSYVTDSIILLLVATAVALLSRRLRIPYVTGLVFAGLAIASFLPGKTGLNPALILNLFLPILLFESAINTDISRLRSTLKPITMLAGPGVLVCCGVTAIALKYSLGLDWIAALLLGILLAITDTVSVIAVFKEISVPSRLTTIVEGESLVNDGAALVLFNLVLQAHLTSSSVPILEGAQKIFIAIAGGSLLGVAIGYLSAGLLKRSDDNLSSILLTVAIALGTYQAGYAIGVSGVVAVVIAGLIVGNIGVSKEVSASNRVTLFSFWEYAGFGVNTFIFLLVGVEVDLSTLWNTLPAVLLAILAYQTGRILSVYPLIAIVNRFDRPIPWRWKHVLFLGNIKGSLSMALALTIPASLTNRSFLIAVVFGTVLLSLVVQGLSLPWLIQKLNLTRVSAARRETEDLRAQLITAKAAQDELDGMLKKGVVPKAVYEELRSLYQVQVAKAEKTLRDRYNQWSTGSALSKGDPAQLDMIRRRLLLAEKGALTDALRQRIVSEAIAKSRIQELDEKLLNLDDD